MVYGALSGACLAGDAAGINIPKGLDGQGNLSKLAVMTQQSDNRPVFLDLTRIRMPLSAIVSILHRLSGLLLILVIPFVLCLLEQSLSGADGYERAMSLSTPAMLLGFFVLLGLFHHLFSGIRFLLIDLDIGLARDRARLTALCVLIAGITATLLTLAMLL